MDAEEIRRIDTRWKSDVDVKLDRLVRFVEKYDSYLYAATNRERKSAEFWDRMKEHAAKWGMISIISGAFYAMYLGAKTIVRSVL